MKKTLKKDKALVVLSGGQDSTTCLFWAVKNYGADNVSAVTFDYGQRHRNAEIEAAKKVVLMANIEQHSIISLPNLLLSESPLTSGRPLEQYEDYATMTEQVGSRVEDTFVPMRNALFLTIAVNRAVALNCTSVVIGVSQEDTANYPDCSSAFIAAYQQMSRTCLPYIRGVVLRTPLMYMTKAQAIKMVVADLGLTAYTALGFTHTSYAGEYPPVDKNHANILRAKGFEEAGIPDPLIVRAFTEGLMELPDTPNYYYDVTRSVLTADPIFANLLIGDNHVL